MRVGLEALGHDRGTAAADDPTPAAAPAPIPSAAPRGPTGWLVDAMQRSRCHGRRDQADRARGSGHAPLRRDGAHLLVRPQRQSGADGRRSRWPNRATSSWRPREGFGGAGMAGDLVAGMARNRGVAAIVTDGMVRDREGIAGRGPAGILPGRYAEQLRAQRPGHGGLADRGGRRAGGYRRPIARRRGRRGGGAAGGSTRSAGGLQRSPRPSARSRPRSGAGLTEVAGDDGPAGLRPRALD